MANEEHLAILKRRVEEWNRWREETKEIPDLGGVRLDGANLKGANLSHAQLNDADLIGADLSRANLTGANLEGTNLRGAIFIDASLSNANLTGADLIGVDFWGAQLSNAQFIGAYLYGAHLAGADLEGVNFSHASLYRANLRDVSLHNANFEDTLVGFTEFANCDLSEAKGLALVRHEGPSTIGIDTMFASKGNIPESFLRGCGVPEGFITQVHSLVGAEDGIQFYSCFISYSSKDEEFARRLHGRMRDAHLRVWFAPEDIQGGKKLHEQIETAIRFYDKLLIVLSEASLQSEWVMDELRKGFKAERDTGKRKLFPVRLTDYETLERWECRDSISGKDLAEEVRQYFIPDFSNWKDHDQFETAFARLLKDLRAEERAK